MLDKYFHINEQRTDLSFKFFYVTNKKTIDKIFIDNVKDSILTSYRSLEHYQILVEGRSEDEIKQYILDYVIPPASNIIDLIVRQGDWGEIFVGLIVTHFQGLAIPINKLQWKINKDKSVFGTDLIAFNQGDTIEDIYYYEIKTRINSHKKEGKNPNRDYISILAHNSLLKDQNAPNEMIADFLARLFIDRKEYDTARKFNEIVKNPQNYNRKFELFFIVEEDKYNENIFEELNNLPPQLNPLSVTVIIIKDLSTLINDTWSNIEERILTLINP